MTLEQRITALAQALGADIKTLLARSGVVVLTDAATITTNAGAGDVFRVTLGGNRTLANPSNAADGKKFTYEITQDATGSRTITLGSKFSLPSGATLILSTAPNKIDYLHIIYNQAADKFRVVGFEKGFS